MSDRSRALERSMRRLDQALQEQSLSPEADERILAAMRAAREGDETPQTSWSFSMGWAVAVAAVALLFGGGVSLLSKATAPQGTRMGGLLVVRGAVIFVPGATAKSADTLQCESPRCRLRFVSRRTRIQLKQKARILRVDQQLQMLQGVASFDVSRRKVGELPLRIAVSHGIVEVIGTGFTIYQSQRGGRLDLHHGRVRFLHNDGTRQEIIPGQSLHWPRRRGRARRSRGRWAMPAARRHDVAPMPSRLSPHQAPRGASPTLRLGPKTTRGKVQPPRVVHHRKRVGGVAIHGPGQSSGHLPPAPRSAPPDAGTGAPTVTSGHVVRRRPQGATSPSHRMPRQVAGAAPWASAADRQAMSQDARPAANARRKAVSRRAMPRKQKVVLPALAGWIRELDQLRSQGHYVLAARKLQGHLRTLRKFSTKYQSARERLHYELGILLTHQLSRPRQACRHWREHQRMFSRSPRYTREVASYLTQLKCR